VARHSPSFATTADHIIVRPNRHAPQFQPFGFIGRDLEDRRPPMSEADAFRALGEDRRKGLWKVRGLSEAPLPLFAGAGAREAEFSPEGLEPTVALDPMTDGREVVEDHRTMQLSLRAHPVSFLRGDLARRGVQPCAALAAIKNGRHVTVAGVILVRQKPGSAKGVLFITIEDEAGVAQGIIWPDRFETYRRVVMMSSSMVSLRGRLQKEGEVIHVIVDRIDDLTPMLRQIGAMAFPHRTGRGDGATHNGSPDRGDAGWVPKPSAHYHPPFAGGAEPEDLIRIRSHDFH
jgi:error-prone DNA polymerase